MKKEIAEINMNHYVNRALRNRAILLYSVSIDRQREALTETMRNTAIGLQFYEEVHPIRSRILKFMGKI